ncbi:MAG: radical SAM protein [Elusimicrobia bacterium]|nr:radical SAM protein [Elusimicrobiota bacterium]
MALDHLAVYLSNSCNLACSYCYVAVNQGPAARLSFEQIRRAVDEFVAKVPPERRKITFIGGEPMLDWPLFTRAARYARAAAGPEGVLQTFTNGTLLTPEKTAFFQEVGVHCTVSLDGKKADNDKHRVYYKTTERSVYDDVLARLEPLDKSNLGVSLVFTSETVDHLLSNVDAFHRMGFGRITFNPELYEVWPDEKIAVMRTVLKGMSRWYRALLDAGVKPPQLQILFAVLEAAENARTNDRWWHDCHNMTLGPEGNYYSCDKALSFPVGAAADLRSGDTKNGVDWEERQKLLDDPTSFIESEGEGSGQVFCPIGVVEHARHAGRDPGASLKNFRRVADAFAEGLKDLIARCEGHPAYEELYGRPRVS